MKHHTLIAMAALLVGCQGRSATLKLLETSKWAASVENCDASYLTFDQDRVVSHGPGNSAYPILDIAIARQEKDARVVTLSFVRASGSTKPADEVVRSIEDKTMGFLVTDQNLEAITKIWGNKGELGGVIRRSDPAYKFFDLVRCP